MTEIAEQKLTTPAPADDAEKIKAELATLKAENAAYKLKEVVATIAQTHGVSPDLLIPLASKLTQEELTEYAKKLPKASEVATQIAALKLDSNRGGSTSSGLGRIRDMSLNEYAKTRDELWEQVKQR